MVSEKKKKSLAATKKDLEKWSVIGLLDMHKLPARQLGQIREKLREKATIKMVKKAVMKLALEQSKKENLKDLLEHIQGEPALLLSNENPFKLANMISKSKTKAKAKEGDIAPEEIVIPKGPTSLPAGPAIGDLQRMKIPAMVQDGKIAVKDDTVVAKPGDEINAGLADLLTKLDIEPMEVGLNLIAAWDNGCVFGKEILFVPPEKYVDDLKAAFTGAFNVANYIGYITKYNAELLVSKAHLEAINLAVNANILNKETVKTLVSKAYGEGMVIKGMVKEPAPEEKTEEVKEAKPEEKKEEAKEEKKEEPKEEAKPEEKKEVKEEEKKTENPSEDKEKKEENK